MGYKENLKKRRERARLRIRRKLQGTADRPRLVVYRSLSHIYAQLVDDENAKTIVSASSKSKEIEAKVKDSKGKIDKSKEVGKLIGEKAKSANIESVIFDRNGYLYHGRVKALADGARESGLHF
ncbi:MAG: 50S ribosomal protein L18 [Ignavibacteriae bacterium]|nr:50S ribosomal protein L18 [Ignavibacteriota bacterium]MCB9242774.1 50S ribosomal protein L18 [Ignavibacteriales bacterium]